MKVYLDMKNLYLDMTRHLHCFNPGIHSQPCNDLILVNKPLIQYVIMILSRTYRMFPHYLFKASLNFPRRFHCKSGSELFPGPPDHPKFGWYRHYKGDFYVVYGSVLNTETNEVMVLYSNAKIVKNDERNPLQMKFVRPSSMFTEYVEHNGQKILRFERVSQKPIWDQLSETDKLQSALDTDEPENATVAYYKGLAFKKFGLKYSGYAIASFLEAFSLCQPDETEMKRKCEDELKKLNSVPKNM